MLGSSELLGDIPREAKELFVLINGFEWRKRTMGAKFEPSKLRQLILEGCEIARSRVESETHLADPRRCD
jgi:hypothetical protein